MNAMEEIMENVDILEIEEESIYDRLNGKNEE